MLRRDDHGKDRLYMARMPSAEKRGKGAVMAIGPVASGEERASSSRV